MGGKGSQLSDARRKAEVCHGPKTRVRQPDSVIPHTWMDDCCISSSALNVPSHKMITWEGAEVQGEPIPLRSRKERDTACWLWVGWIRAERRAASGRQSAAGVSHPALADVALLYTSAAAIRCTPRLRLRREFYCSGLAVSIFSFSVLCTAQNL